MSDQPLSDFEKTAESRQDQSFLSELFDFLRHNKKWWLLPILLVLLLMGILAFLSGSVAAPFIYPLF